MLQDLREYLEENPDNAVAPEWSETVRKSVRINNILLLQDFAVQKCAFYLLIVFSPILYLVERMLPVLYFA